MRTTLPFIVLSFLLGNCAPPAPSKDVTTTKPPTPEKAILFAQKHPQVLAGSGQVLVVYNARPESHAATLVALEKTGSEYRVKFGPMAAGVGKNGFAARGDKRESDGKSPTGCYRLGRLFTYEASVNTAWPFTQSTPEDKWIDDPESPDYNRYVHGPTSAKSFEKLLLLSDSYKYCQVIEYNTDSVVKGMGSAIFFHLSNATPGPTLGCVAIPEPAMRDILAWLQPDQQPMILMGNEQSLAEGW